jgi:hypothetical protein
MEAAERGNPRSFYVAVTVVLERLKRGELKRKIWSQRNEAYFRFFLQAPCSLHASLVILSNCAVRKNLEEYL